MGKAVDIAGKPREGETRRGQGRLRQRALMQALATAQAAGLHVARFEIDPDGKIVVVTGRPSTADALDEQLSEFEAKHAR